MNRTTWFLPFVVLAFLVSGRETPSNGDVVEYPADHVFLHGGVYTVEALATLFDGRAVYRADLAQLQDNR